MGVLNIKRCKRYIILDEFARKEIIENESNKDLAIANAGLDCSDIIFQGLFFASIKYINSDDVIQLIHNTSSLSDIDKFNLIHNYN